MAAFGSHSHDIRTMSYFIKFVRLLQNGCASVEPPIVAPPAPVKGKIMVKPVEKKP